MKKCNWEEKPSFWDICPMVLWKKVSFALGKVGLLARLGSLDGWKEARGPSWGLPQRNFVEVTQIEGKVKEHENKFFCEEKIEKAKAKKRFKVFLKSGCLGTNDAPGVFAIVIMKIESEIGIVWNFEKIWIGVLNYAVKNQLEYVKTIRKMLGI